MVPCWRLSKVMVMSFRVQKVELRAGGRRNSRNYLRGQPAISPYRTALTEYFEGHHQTFRLLTSQPPLPLPTRALYNFHPGRKLIRKPCDRREKDRDSSLESLRHHTRRAEAIRRVPSARRAYTKAIRRGGYPLWPDAYDLQGQLHAGVLRNGWLP